MPAPKAVVTNIVLPKLDIRSVNIRLVGDSPLITHAWSEKAKKAMLDKQMKKATPKKDAKDPWLDFCDSLHWLSPKPEYPTQKDVEKAKFGFPTIGFKSAAVSACSHIEGVTKVLARGVFHITGEFAQIEGTPVVMREDMVKIAMGTADLRYRGMFEEWSVTLPLRYNATVLSLEQVFQLFDTAGFAIGVGEWRPERDGNFGMFHVATGDQ